MRERLDVLVAWLIGLLAISAAALLLTGCGLANPSAVSASTFTSVEMALVDDTARWAGQLGVKVEGRITTDRYVLPDGAEAAGWYSGGIAYYNRDMAAKWISLVPEPGRETAANVAAHEVAHAIYHNHDASHWCCTQHMGAGPTYPAPIAGLVCDGRATRCLTK